jgi:hypothetical protein
MRGIPDEFEGCGGGSCLNPSCNQPPAQPTPASSAACDVVTTTQDIEPNVTFGLGINGNYEFFGADTSVGTGVSLGFKAYFDNYRGFGITRTIGLSGQSKASGTTESVGLNFSEDSLEGARVGAQASLALGDGVSFSADASFDPKRGLSALSVGAQYSYQSTPLLTVKNDLTSFLGYAKPAALPSTGREMRGSNIEVSFKGGGEVYGNYINGSASGFFNEEHIAPANAGANVTQAFGYLHLEKALALDKAGQKVALDFNRERDGPIYDASPNLAMPVVTSDLFVASGRDLTGTFRAYRNDVPVVFDPHQESELTGGAVGVDIGSGDFIKVGVNAAINGNATLIGRWDGGNGDALINDARNSYAADPTGYRERTYFKFIGELSVSNAPAPTMPVAVPLSAVAWSPPPPLVPPAYFAADPIDLGLPNSGNESRVPRATLIEAFTYKDLYENYKALPEFATDYFAVCGQPSGAQPTCRDWYRRDNHIAGFRITTPGGVRYIYGIAVYNTKYEEHKFSVDRSQCPSNQWCTTLFPPKNANGLSNAAYDYGAVSDAAVTSAPREGFLEIKTISPYPTSYLLTAIIGPDYVDAVSNGVDGTVGPSDGDYGYWVKFRYERDAADFRWRTPYLGVSFVRGPENGQFVDTTGGQRLHDKGYFTYGARESWHLSSIETATHKAYMCVNTKDRTDAIGAGAVTPFQNAIPASGFARSPRLDKVQLFSKAQLGPNAPANCAGLIANQTPLVAAELEYDYSLAPCTRNTTADPCAPGVDPHSQNNGKLTLKKISFSHLGNTRGALSPYEFAYADGTPPENPQHREFNPPYEEGDHDRWNTYQPRPSSPPQTSPPDAIPPLDDYLAVTGDHLAAANQKIDDLDTWSSAWALRHITEPSGRIIDVKYEADDYAYVQNKPAMRMFQMASVNDDPDSNPSQICPVGIAQVTVPIPGAFPGWVASAAGAPALAVPCGPAASSAPRIHFTLDKELPCSTSNPDDCTNSEKEIKGRYVGGNQQVFFKMRVALKGDPSAPAKWQTVSGYAQIANVGLDPDPDPSKSTSARGWIELIPVRQNIPTSINYNPLAHAAWQYLRLEQPELIHESTFAMVAGDILSQALGVMDVADVIPDILDLLGLATGVYPGWAISGWGQTIDRNHSYIRLQDPYGMKKGGGARVKRISFSDDWSSTSAQGHDLITGYEYSYQLDDGRSSGVASYEPMTAGEDNPLHIAKPFTDQVLLSSNYNLFAELPIGEANYPAPSVGYSRVVRRTLAAVHEVSAQPPHPTSIGPTVYEYYTARDFPVRQTETAIDKRRNPFPQTIPIPLLGMITLNSLAASQGYVTISNDMHGKLKRVTSYEYVGDAPDPITHDYATRAEPVKETRYNYKQMPNDDSASFDLSNAVQVLDFSVSGADVKTQTMAEDSDAVVDMRINQTQSWDAGLNLNVDSFFVAEFPVPIPVPMPNFGYSLSETKTIVTNRSIHRAGILDSVNVRERSARVTTSNLNYDLLSGGASLTSSDNAYGNLVYHYNAPARWIYPRMGAAYDHVGRIVDLVGSGVNGRRISPPLGRVTLCEEGPPPYSPKCLPLGSELSIANASTGGVRLTLQQDENKSPVLVAADDTSSVLSVGPNDSGAPVVTNSVQAVVLRSGNRNLLTAATDSILALSNPLKPSGILKCARYNDRQLLLNGGVIDNVLDARHTSYSDTWPEAAQDVRFAGTEAAIASAQAEFNARDAFARGERGIFRPAADYVYVTARSQSQPKVDLTKDGTFSLEQFGVFQKPWPCTNNWQLKKLHLLYSAAGFGVEEQNALQVPSSALYGNHGTAPVAVANNARHNEIAYEGFESYEPNTVLSVSQTGEGNLQFETKMSSCVASLTGTCPDIFVTNLLAHSGHRSLSVTKDTTVAQPQLNLKPGMQYVVSAWVSRGAPGNVQSDVATYATGGAKPGGLKLEFDTFHASAHPISSVSTAIFEPSGPVIDSWQRIEGVFTVPFNAQQVAINFLSGNGAQFGNPLYFDDVRILPEDASLESYVYDQTTLRLIATLDQNNFATFFGYAPNGKVEVIRRETMRGVLAEKEGRIHLRERP